MIVEIGARLRSERERLGLGQEEMGRAGGSSRTAQQRYERGESAPDADYLAALVPSGLDIGFVITGVRTGRGSITPEESTLLDAYRATSGPQRSAALLVAQALAAQAAAADAPMVYPAPGTPMQPASARRLHQPPPAYGDDAQLWRAIARAMPTTPGADPTARLTVQQWLDIVDGAYQRERAARAQQSTTAPRARQEQ